MNNRSGSPSASSCAGTPKGGSIASDFEQMHANEVSDWHAYARAATTLGSAEECRAEFERIAYDRELNASASADFWVARARWEELNGDSPASDSAANSSISDENGSWRALRMLERGIDARARPLPALVDALASMLGRVLSSRALLSKTRALLDRALEQQEDSRSVSGQMLEQHGADASSEAVASAVRAAVADLHGGADTATPSASTQTSTSSGAERRAPIMLTNKHGSVLYDYAMRVATEVARSVHIPITLTPSSLSHNRRLSSRSSRLGAPRRERTPPRAMSPRRTRIQASPSRVRQSPSRRRVWDPVTAGADWRDTGGVAARTLPQTENIKASPSEAQRRSSPSGSSPPLRSVSANRTPRRRTRTPATMKSPYINQSRSRVLKKREKE